MGEALSGQPLPYIFSLSLFCIISLPYYHSLTGVYDVRSRSLKSSVCVLVLIPIYRQRKEPTRVPYYYEY